MNTSLRAVQATLFLMLLAWVGGSMAANSSTGDGLLVKAYEGSKFEWQKDHGFIRVELPSGPPDAASKDTKGKTEVLEGYVTQVAYSTYNMKRSTLEVSRNYEQALEAGGFKLLFKCANRDKSCGRYDTEPVVGSFPKQDEYYVIGRSADKRTGDVLTIAVRVPEPFYHHIIVVRSKAMDTGMAKVDAAAMEKGIATQGHMALYGIQFDFGKASLKPESTPVLAEIAGLLKQQPSLKLHVVGHTDNVGSFDSNMALSRARAATVVDALVKQHGIAANRLMAHGAASVAPVSTNRTDAGRAENRRVELVEM
jgi:OOP family OmpA-OmpF porin